jgi:hypothetical protein
VPFLRSEHRYGLENKRRGRSLVDTGRRVSAIRGTTRVNTYHVMAAVAPHWPVDSPHRPGHRSGARSAGAGPAGQAGYGGAVDRRLPDRASKPQWRRGCVHDRRPPGGGATGSRDRPVLSSRSIRPPPTRRWPGGEARHQQSSNPQTDVTAPSRPRRTRAQSKS